MKRVLGDKDNGRVWLNGSFPVLKSIGESSEMVSLFGHFDSLESVGIEGDIVLTTTSRGSTETKTASYPKLQTLVGERVLFEFEFWMLDYYALNNSLDTWGYSGNREAAFEKLQEEKMVSWFWTNAPALRSVFMGVSADEYKTFYSGGEVPKWLREVFTDMNVLYNK